MRNNKGKVHPFTSAAAAAAAEDTPTVFKLLPAAILTLVSLLSADDRQVLAYMLSRSLNSAACSAACSSASPNFSCDCFHCYTAFWHRWDSSPNRDLIHRAIEAFEDRHGPAVPRKTKKKDRRRTGKPPCAADSPPPEEINNCIAAAAPPEAEVALDVGKEDEAEAAPVVAAAPSCSSHRGLARKVLPDVMGIFNSRLWSLWSPNL